MGKKKSFSILKAFIAAICFVFIVISVVTNVMFYDGKIPKILNRYIYVVGDDANIGDKVTKGSALIPKDAANEIIGKGTVVLCYPPDDPQNLCLRIIYDLDSINGTYRTCDDSVINDVNQTITKNDILAVVSGYPESRDLGRFITFTTSVKGILLELILPCVILVIFLIIKIASVKSKDDENEGYDFYEYEEGGDKPQRNSHVKNGTPLFEASQEIQPSDELERKKMSIAENFSQKKVNPDSPYQKEKERTMQFKAQRSAESSFAARNKGGSSSTAPTADALREEMLRKTAEAERTAPTVPDNTGVLSKAQLAEMARGDVPKTAPLKSPYAKPAAPASSSPDIDDIITRSNNNAKKKSASDMSIDDLLKIIEDEKKKL
ncbi:MAG: hypothetical protein PUB97_08120 [Ruminococcus sp.]|nr:hypothetical protein [Ruminococcus sp.]